MRLVSLLSVAASVVTAPSSVVPEPFLYAVETMDGFLEIRSLPSPDASRDECVLGLDFRSPSVEYQSAGASDVHHARPEVHLIASTDGAARLFWGLPGTEEHSLVFNDVLSVDDVTRRAAAQPIPLGNSTQAVLTGASFSAVHYVDPHTWEVHSSGAYQSIPRVSPCRGDGAVAEPTFAKLVLTDARSRLVAQAPKQHPDWYVSSRRLGPFGAFPQRCSADSECPAEQPAPSVSIDESGVWLGDRVHVKRSGVLRVHRLRPTALRNGAPGILTLDLLEERGLWTFPTADGNGFLTAQDGAPWELAPPGLIDPPHGQLPAAFYRAALTARHWPVRVGDGDFAHTEVEALLLPGGPADTLETPTADGAAGAAGAAPNEVPLGELVWNAIKQPVFWLGAGGAILGFVLFRFGRKLYGFLQPRTREQAETLPASPRRASSASSRPSNSEVLERFHRLSQPASGGDMSPQLAPQATQSMPILARSSTAPHIGAQVSPPFGAAPAPLSPRGGKSPQNDDKVTRLDGNRARSPDTAATAASERTALDETLQNGLFRQTFSNVRLIGRGGFGAVVEATRTLEKEDYAVKSVSLGRFDSSVPFSEHEQRNAELARQLREVYTFSKLGLRDVEAAKHVVRYVTCWLEAANYLDPVMLRANAAEPRKPCEPTMDVRIPEASVSSRFQRSVRAGMDSSAGSSYGGNDDSDSAFAFAPRSRGLADEVDALSNDRPKNGLNLVDNSAPCDVVLQVPSRPPSAASEPQERQMQEVLLLIQMERVPGPTLRQWLDDPQLHTSAFPAKREELAISLLEALACIHSRGVYHADLKPPNTFVVRDDDGKFRVLLADFGLARQDRRTDERHQHSASHDPTTVSRLSVASDGLDGTVTMSTFGGTLVYSPPEGFCASGPSDVYSVGLMLLELFLQGGGTRMERAIAFEKLRTKHEVDASRLLCGAAVRELVLQMCCVEKHARLTSAAALSLARKLLAV